MSLKTEQVRLLKRCAASPSFFINNLAYISHPTFGKMPFKLFGYQQECLAQFIDNRFNLFHKVRQSGVSTLCGAFALWRAMFYKGKTILIVSKRDDDAMDFLRKNVRYIYDNLPPWVQDLWSIDSHGGSANEHRMVFPNESRITSLTSSANTLRSHASSLNIIDEAAFMPKMDEMWAGGAPTLVHGGHVIVISTPFGIGNWYWRTVKDAEEGVNNFNLINIPWWHMDWVLEGMDQSTGNFVRIAPRDDIEKCVTKEDRIRFGPHKSPWLEEQYRNMASRGEDGLFRQEYLRDFLGTGNTVLDRAQLEYIRTTVDSDYKVVGMVNYKNPVTQDRDVLDFDEKLWVWKEPDPNHTYVVGADVSTGEAHDYSGVQVWDITAKEQVAELKIRVFPKTLARMTDYIGRWYNNAMLIVERNSIGATVCHELQDDLSYPSLFREVKQNRKLRKTVGLIGFTTTSRSKPELNASLINNIGEDGFQIKSSRLMHEAEIYVHLSKARTGAEEGPSNTDDLIMAAALGLFGIPQAVRMNAGILAPLHSTGFGPELKQNKSWSKTQEELNKKLEGFSGMLPPMSINAEQPTAKESAALDIANFTKSLGGVPIGDKKDVPVVVKRKHQL